MASTVIAGKPSNTVGEKDSTLILRGSSVKYLWGNKFIDLFKNGKINVESTKILKTADSIESASSDGIYLIEDSVWVVIGETKIQLNGDSTTTYISYLVEQPDITADLKRQALTNIGFYYETLEQAQNAELTSGIIYVLGDSKLYVVLDGVLTEYLTSSNEVIQEETVIYDLYIEDYSLWLGNELYITCNNNLITAHKQLLLENGLQSNGATSFYGFRLYVENGKSYLEVDNLIVRNTTPDKVSIYPVKYYLEENVILQVINPTDKDANIDELQLTLLYSSKYLEGDILTTSILVDVEEIKQELISIDFKIGSLTEEQKNNNIYPVLVISNADRINSNTVSYLVNKSVFYKSGKLPVARIQDHNYDLFESSEDDIKQDLKNIKTRIGSITEVLVPIDLDIIKEVSKYTDKELGIYSDNAVLIDSKLIKAEFKDLNPDDNEDSLNKYPKYGEDLQLPTIVENLIKFDLAVPNIKWVKQIIDIAIPIGTIIMYHGNTEDLKKSEWAVCDGENGTPDLRDRFIVGSSDMKTDEEYRDPKDVVKEDGIYKYQLTTDNLPKHSHPHKEHTHNISRQTTSANGAHLRYALDYNTGSRISSVSGEGVSSSSGSVITSVSLSSDSSGNHTHSISAHLTEGTTSEEDNWQYEESPVKIPVLPKSCSMIFIMKIKNLTDL